MPIIYNKKNIRFCQDVFPLFHSLPTAAAFHIFFKKQMHKKHHTGLRGFFIEILLKNLFFIIRHYISPILIIMLLCFICNFSVLRYNKFAVFDCVIDSKTDRCINKRACSCKTELFGTFFNKVRFLHTALFAQNLNDCI